MNKCKKIIWYKAEHIQFIFNLLSKNGGEARIVGGAIRNYLLGAEINDIDFCSTHSPNQLIQLAKKNNIKYIKSGIKYGTVILCIKNKYFEVTSLRKDVATNGRHATVIYGVSFIEDAKRRDFTFNALYMSSNGFIYDPLNSGLIDIKQLQIKFIGNATKRIQEDYLRILRYFRFIAYFGCNIIQKDFNQIIPLIKGLNKLSSERLLKEFKQIYSSKYIIIAVKMMDKCNIFNQIFNTNLALDKLKYVVENNFNFNYKWLIQLFISLSKITTKQFINIFKISNQEQKILNNIKFHFDILEFNTNKLIYLIYKNNKETVIHNLIVNAAKKNFNAIDLHYKIKFIKECNVPTFPINGQDLLNLGYKESIKLKKILKKLENIWIKSKFKKTKDNLLLLIKD